MTRKRTAPRRNSGRRAAIAILALAASLVSAAPQDRVPVRGERPPQAREFEAPTLPSRGPASELPAIVEELAVPATRAAARARLDALGDRAIPALSVVVEQEGPARLPALEWLATRADVEALAILLRERQRATGREAARLDALVEEAKGNVPDRADDGAAVIFAELGARALTAPTPTRERIHWGWREGELRAIELPPPLAARARATRCLEFVEALDPELDNENVRLLRARVAEPRETSNVTEPIDGGARVDPLSNVPAVDLEKSIDRITVFYGTDRAPTEERGIDYLLRFRWAAIALGGWFLSKRGLTALLRDRYRFLARATAGFILLLAIGLTLEAAYSGVRARIRWNRLGFEYGDRRDPLFDEATEEYCHLGTCQVSIPKERREPFLYRPNPLRGDFLEDPEKHYVVMRIAPREDRDRFFDDVTAAAGAGDGTGARAFVFVHGFNIDFEEAALRTAQIAVDLDFDGAPIFFSWPSRSRILQYTHDESAVAWSAAHLRRFLLNLRRRLPDAELHLCAHSMGNRALTEALRRLADELEGERFQQLILAAPDIDAETFRHDIAPALLPAVEGVTMYVSPRDQALSISRDVHGYPRAGDSEERIVVVDGIDTIEVRQEANSVLALGHSYYAEAPAVLLDIRSILRGIDLGQRERDASFDAARGCWVIDDPVSRE